MATTKDIIPFYKLALDSEADMTAQVRYDLKIPCKTGLLAAMCIDQIASPQTMDALLKEIAREEDLAVFETFKNHILEKSQLERLYERLKSMGSGKEMLSYFGFILDSGPGMNNFVKLDIKITCRVSFLVVIALDRGVSGTEFKKLIGPENLALIETFKTEILKKAHLEKTYEALNDLTKSKE